MSYHLVPRLPVQFWHRILGFGTQFDSLWAHPLPRLTLSQPYLVGHQTGACSEAPHPLNRVRLCYAYGAARPSLLVCKSMRRSCKTGWMDGWMERDCVCVQFMKSWVDRCVVHVARLRLAAMV
eukprot:357527-Chlamydomonas_euryale.AAC.5